MDAAPPPRRKLIEVSLPLEVINREAAREKSIRHGHPSTLHLWWARRPLAAARAVLFAQLVDDPSSHPDRFPDEESVRLERKRLHNLIERLVVWENSNDEALLAEAHAEILTSTDGNPPPILDPFCGGGTIPLEAQRLGLEAHGSDLNPVAVLITKALVEIPPKFANRPPVFPGLAETSTTWRGAEGLAADVRAYGQWMRDEAEKRIGHLYPKATLPAGTKANVIAWIWARTVICPNPACGIEMPLVRSWWLGKKKGKEAYVEPYLVDDASAPGGRRVAFSIGHGLVGAPTAETDGTVGRTGAECIACHSAVPFSYVRAEGQAKRIDTTLMAIVAEGRRQRIYVPPSPEHVAATELSLTDDLPEGNLPEHTLGFRVQAYGMTAWVDLFTQRQLVAMTTFTKLVSEAREKLTSGVAQRRQPQDVPKSVITYEEAVTVFLALSTSRFANFTNALCQWRPDAGKEQVGHLFARQAVPMVWDFAEANPFGSAAGSWNQSHLFPVKTLERHNAAAQAQIDQAPALEIDLDRGQLLCTDPPYYDNVPYADLSDFFYLWLRQALDGVLPRLFDTVLAPKGEELVANSHRHGGQAAARQFFEHGFEQFFNRVRIAGQPDFPIAVFYAFKQTEASREGESSTGWETLLEGMLRSGWIITGTWPMRSELANRVRGQGSNALASSVVLALRPRPGNAPNTDRRGFIAALRAELPDALRELQQGRIAPVDLPQAAIGPGMAIFSRYSSVIEADGSAMRVRSALAHINEALGEVQVELEGDFDPTTRFAIAWFRQHGYATGAFGSADDLARARATAVEAIARTGILTSGGGKVALIRPGDLPNNYDPQADERISVWEVLHHTVRVLEADGIAAAGRLLAQVDARPDGAIDLDLVKELAFLMFAVAEDKRWSKEAVSFNAVATAWPDLVAASRGQDPTHQQTELDLTADEEG